MIRELIMLNKTNTLLILFWMIGYLVLAASFAQAEPTINDITSGELLMGESMTIEDLQDHVVEITFTKERCPTCRVELPHLVNTVLMDSCYQDSKCRQSPKKK